MGAAEALGGSVHDGIEHAIRVVIQFAVPDPQNRPTFPGEERVALLVPLGFGMLAAVKFNDEFRLPAREIGEVRSDRKLTRKLWPKAGNHAPQLAFVPRRAGAQCSCTLCGIERDTAAHGSSVRQARASRTDPSLPGRGVKSTCPASCGGCRGRGRRILPRAGADRAVARLPGRLPRRRRGPGGSGPCRACGWS